MERMTIDEAAELLIETHEAASASKAIRDPVAWSLYKVWKIADTGERQTEHPHGYWKRNLGKCSVCGHIGNPKWKVCVVCGAIMDEVVK